MRQGGSRLECHPCFQKKRRKGNFSLVIYQFSFANREFNLEVQRRPEGPPFNSHDRKVVEQNAENICEARRADSWSVRV